MAHEVKRLPDGKVEFHDDDGFSLKAMDPIEATEELGKARHDRARVAAEWKQKYETDHAELEALKLQQQTPQPVTQQTTKTQEEIWIDWLGDNAATALAKKFGYSTADEMIADRKGKDQLIELYNNQTIAATFLGNHPEYPNTPQANEAITKYLLDRGIAQTPDTLEMAHNTLVIKGEYKNLTPEEQNASWTAGMRAENRQRAAPLLPGGNPELSTNQETNPWAMKLDDLRKAALAEGRK